MKYLYNDVKLPDLPGYTGNPPFDLIVRLTESGAYILLRSDTKFRILVAEGTEVIGLPAEAAVTAYGCPEGGDQWQETDSGFEPHPDALYVYLNPEQSAYVWTNVDINREDGTCKYPMKLPIAERLPEMGWNKSFLRGLAAGLSGTGGLPGSGQQEVE